MAGVPAAAVGGVLAASCCAGHDHHGAGLRVAYGELAVRNATERAHSGLPRVNDPQSSIALFGWAAEPDADGREVVGWPAPGRGVGASHLWRG